MDKLLLYTLRFRSAYNTLMPAVVRDSIGATTASILDWYGVLFKSYPSLSEVDYGLLISTIKVRCPNLEPSSLKAMELAIGALHAYAPPHQSYELLLQQLHERKAANEIATLINLYNAGEEVDLTEGLHTLNAELLRAGNSQRLLDFCDDDPLEVLKESFDDVGIKFRQPVLQQHIRGLLSGDSALIAAVPDAGKTAFLCDFVTYAVPQLRARYGEHRPVLWLNNEGAVRRIAPRLMQSALGVSVPELSLLASKGTAYTEYHEALNGHHSYIKLKDAHGCTLFNIEQLIDAVHPSLVVYDMPANFKMGGEDKHTSLELFWQGMRELAVKYDLISVGTAQISFEGRNLLYPPQSAIKDSKTAVQGAVDLMLFLGKLNDPEYANIRGVSLPKNKLGMPNKSTDINETLEYQAAIQRYA